MSADRLKAEILSMSLSTEWELAKREWRLERAHESKESATCLCGHHPIHDMCMLVNDLTQREAAVGNCCVKKFIGIDSDALFQALKRIRVDPARSMGDPALQWALSQGWITDWEVSIYHQASKKNASSGPHAERKLRINQDFEKRMSQGGASAPAQAKPEGEDFY